MLSESSKFEATSPTTTSESLCKTLLKFKSERRLHRGFTLRNIPKPANKPARYYPECMASELVWKIRPLIGRVEHLRNDRVRATSAAVLPVWGPRSPPGSDFELAERKVTDE